MTSLVSAVILEGRASQSAATTDDSGMKSTVTLVGWLGELNNKFCQIVSDILMLSLLSTTAAHSLEVLLVSPWPTVMLGKHHKNLWKYAHK